MQLVAYRRVSTKDQGDSGNGLDAQDVAITRFARDRGASVLATYTEVESGRNCSRPQLAAALAHARKAKAVLVVAKLDRLARNARFLLGIVESGVEVAFCDLPSLPPGAAGKMILTQMAAVAEYEAARGSERTKEGLAAAKAKGVELGTPRNLTHADRVKGAHLHREEANRAYSLLVPAIKHWRSQGDTLAQIADRLNQDGHTTRTRSQWSAVQVKRVLDRA